MGLGGRDGVVRGWEGQGWGKKVELEEGVSKVGLGRDKVARFERLREEC